MKKKNKLEYNYQDFDTEESLIQINDIADSEIEQISENEILSEVNEDDIDTLFESDIINIEEPITKIETCRIAKINNNGIIIDFKGYGLWIKTIGLIDKDLIPKDYIDVAYISDIGLPDFSMNLIFK